MDGLWVLFLLMFTAALPVILAYLWFRVKKFPLSLPWFLLSLLAGALALPLAALVQYFLPAPALLSSPASGPALAFMGTFIRIALTEELGRLLPLILLFTLAPPLLRSLASKNRPFHPDEAFVPPPVPEPAIMGGASGLLAGLGFALVENAFYGAADISITLLRAFTAAPLHGACGARVGQAAMTLRQSPARALLRFAAAVVIHGMYNFMLISPGIPPFFPALIALSALAASILSIQRST